MKVIELGRRGGKTTQILHWLWENPNAIMVTTSPAAADHAFKMARDLELTYVAPDPEKSITGREGIQRRQIVTTYDFGARQAGWSASAVAIDNLEHVLYDLFHAPVRVVSFTADEVTDGEVSDPA